MALTRPTVAPHPSLDPQRAAASTAHTIERVREPWGAPGRSLEDPPGSLESCSSKAPREHAPVPPQPQPRRISGEVETEEPESAPACFATSSRSAEGPPAGEIQTRSAAPARSAADLAQSCPPRHPQALPGKA